MVWLSQIMEDITNALMCGKSTGQVKPIVIRKCPRTGKWVSHKLTKDDKSQKMLICNSLFLQSLRTRNENSSA